MTMPVNYGHLAQGVAAPADAPRQCGHLQLHFNSALRSAKQGIGRFNLWLGNPRRNEQDLWALARSIELEHPSLAAELRFSAMCRPIEEGAAGAAANPVPSPVASAISAFFASLRRRVAAARRWTWAALEAHGNDRARRQLLTLARHCQFSRPELAKEMLGAYREMQVQRRRIGEAAEVRAMAYGLRNRDPGFAADLYAAADRHEQAGPPSSAGR